MVYCDYKILRGFRENFLEFRWSQPIGEKGSLEKIQTPIQNFSRDLSAW